MKMQANRRAIDKIYKRRDRYDIPEWQRQEVWNHSKKQQLIDSILRGWKLPKFYFLKISKEPEAHEVVDGQQRLIAIFEFFDNELQLSDKTAKDFGGRYYTELPDKYSDAFDDYEIEFDEIDDASDEDVREFFQRLQEGLRLTSSEKLNSTKSKLRDFIMRQTKHPFFDKVTASDKRYGHFDILAKTAAIEIDGIEVGLRYDDLLAVFKSQANFSSRSNVAQRIISALGFVDNGFEEGSTLLRNRTIVQALLTMTCRLIRSGKAVGRERHLAEFFEIFLKELNKQVELGQKATDPDYLLFQRTVNANVKSGARIRQEILLRKLLNHDPAFIEMLDQATIVESGLSASIRGSAHEITSLVGGINEKYSAQHGTNLFKPTNKTARAHARMGNSIQDYDGYKTFIEDLYYLFHEGVGNRLQPNAPSSFGDINMLRTDLQHDLEHGKATRVRAKKKKVGQVFMKYGGVLTPVSLAPERFVVVQANILEALKRDLRMINQQS